MNIQIKNAFWIIMIGAMCCLLTLTACENYSSKENQTVVSNGKQVSGNYIKETHFDINSLKYSPNIIKRSLVNEGFQFPLCSLADSSCSCVPNGSPCHEDTGFGGTCSGCRDDGSDLLGHTGEDYNIGAANQDCGKPVFAVSAGQVVYAQNITTSTWGNTIIIKHTLFGSNMVYSFYSHLKDIMVNQDDVVERGDEIGHVGDGYSSITKNSDQCNDSEPWNAHLHFAIWSESHIIQPMSVGKGYTGYSFDYLSGYIKPYDILSSYKTSNHYYIGWIKDQGWVNDSSDKFLGKYIELKTNACDLGVPVDHFSGTKEVHSVDGVLIQDFINSANPPNCLSNDGDSMLAFNGHQIPSKTYLIKRGFLAAYRCLSINGESMKGPILLGPPSSEEKINQVAHACDQSIVGATVQHFQKGCMWWVPDSNTIHVHLASVDSSDNFDTTLPEGCEAIQIVPNPGTTICPGDQCINMGCSKHRETFDGEIFKTPATGNGVWYARGDYKHSFPTSECYHLFYDDFSGLSCIADANAAALTSGPQVCGEGSFVRRLDSAAIYRFESGKLRALCGDWTSTSFQSRWGYPFNIAVLIDPDKWNGLTTAYQLDYGRGIYPAGQQAPQCGDPGYECGTFTDGANGVCYTQLNCGACPECGDTVCDAAHGENCNSCSSDCGTCTSCGDGICNASTGEDCSTCASDCGQCNDLVAGEITSPSNGSTVSNEQFSINWTPGYSEIGYATETALYCQTDGADWVRETGFGRIPPYTYDPSGPGHTIACKIRTRLSQDDTIFVDSPVVTWYTSSTYPNIVIQSAQLLASPISNGCNDLYIEAAFKNTGDQAGYWRGRAYLHPTGQDETSPSAIKARWDEPLDVAMGATITKTFRINNGFALPLTSGTWSITVISDDYYYGLGSPSRITIPAVGQDTEAPAIPYFILYGYTGTPVEVLPGQNHTINFSTTDEYDLSSWLLRWREAPSGSWQTIATGAMPTNTCDTHLSQSSSWLVPGTLAAGLLLDVSILVTDVSGKTTERSMTVKTRSNAEPSVTFLAPAGGETYTAKTPVKDSCIPVELYFVAGVEILQLRLGLTTSTHARHSVDYEHGKITPLPLDGHVTACINAEHAGDDMHVFAEIYDKNHITHYFYSSAITINFPDPLAPWKRPVLEATQRTLAVPDAISTWTNDMSFSGLRVSNNTITFYRKDAQCPTTYYEGQKKRLDFSRLTFRLSDYGLQSTTKILDNYQEEQGACSTAYALENLRLQPYTNFIAADYDIKDEATCAIVDGEERCDFDLYIREVKNNSVTPPLLIKRYLSQYDYFGPHIRTVTETATGEKFLYVGEYVADDYRSDLFKNSTGTYTFLINEDGPPWGLFRITNGLFGIQEEKIATDTYRYSSFYLNQNDGTRNTIKNIFDTNNYSNMFAFKDPYSDEIHFIDSIRNVPNRRWQYAIYKNDNWTVYSPIIPPDTWRGSAIEFMGLYGIIAKDDAVYFMGQMSLQGDDDYYYFTVPYRSDNTINLDEAYADTYGYGVGQEEISSETATILPDGRLIRVQYCEWNLESRLCFQESFPAGSDCWDNDPCTDDVWNGSTGTCTHEAKQCADDGNQCNGPEVCDSVSGNCVSDPLQAISCDDGNKCNGEETCDLGLGACVSGVPLVREDAYGCTEDLCDELTGLITHTPSNDLCYTEPCFMARCAPENPLAEGDSGCVILEKPLSSDGLDCTEDSCNEITGIPQYDVLPGYCVIGGTCIASGQLSPTSTCLSCDPSSTSYTWTPVSEDTPCNDTLSCTENDKCQSGVCVGSQKYCVGGPATSSCSSMQCTEPSGDCEEFVRENGAPCNDFTVCNGTETCQSGACVSGAALSCDDQNACTIDSCNDSAGCQYTALSDGTICDLALDGTQRCFGGECEDIKVGQTCTQPINLLLGVEYIAHFDGRYDLLQTYTCTDSVFSGPEIYFSLTLSAGEYVITVTPGEGTDPSLFVLDSCEAHNCTGASMELPVGEPEERVLSVTGESQDFIFVVDFTTYLATDSVKVLVRTIAVSDNDLLDTDGQQQDDVPTDNLIDTDNQQQEDAEVAADVISSDSVFSDADISGQENEVQEDMDLVIDETNITDSALLTDTQGADMSVVNDEDTGQKQNNPPTGCGCAMLW